MVTAERQCLLGQKTKVAYPFRVEVGVSSRSFYTPRHIFDPGHEGIPGGGRLGFL